MNPDLIDISYSCMYFPKSIPGEVKDSPHGEVQAGHPVTVQPHAAGPERSHGNTGAISVPFPFVQTLTH